MLSRLAATSALCALALLSAACERPPSPLCPGCNLVVISVDTLRADHVSALGYDKPTTPNIDALARRGVLFENAIAQSSWTRPAHMSIFTGLHPREHGFVSLADSRRLDDSIPTLATVLRERGYTTAAFVGGVNMAASFGFDQGFDVYRSNGKYFRDNMEDVRYWLDNRPDGSFFLFFHGYDAHTPYHNDPIDRQALGLPQRPPETGLATTCRADGAISRVDPFLAEYDAAVHRADRYVGKLIAELETRGLVDRTAIVLLSDHGEEFLEHGRCFHISTLYREALHVPLLVVAPGLATQRVAALVSASVTIAPTAMELLGVEDHPFPGPSLVAAARGGSTPENEVVSETERSPNKKGDGHLRSITSPDGKLIRWTDPERYALFDPRTDPFERSEIQDGSARRGLSSALDAWTVAHPARQASRRRARTGTKEKPGDASKAEDEQLREREEDLKSFGYLE